MHATIEIGTQDRGEVGTGEGNTKGQTLFCVLLQPFLARNSAGPSEAVEQGSRPRNQHDHDQRHRHEQVPAHRQGHGSR